MFSEKLDKACREFLEETVRRYKRQKQIEQGILHEKQNNMKTAKISKDTAKEMINSGIESLKKVAYDTYPELKEKELPERWEDLGEINGYYVSSMSEIRFFRPDFALPGAKNTLPTKELAEAVLALCQLLYLREVYRDGWDKSQLWDNGNGSIHSIELDREGLRVPEVICRIYGHIFTFQDKKTAKLFRDNFRDLLEKTKPLYV